MYYVLWRLHQISRTYIFTKFWFQPTWRHSRECIKDLTPGFLYIFLLVLWRWKLAKFYELFGHFSRTYKVVKFWVIQLHLDVSDVIHANGHTEHANCGLHVNFWNFYEYHFVLWWKVIILSKSCYFGLRSPIRDKRQKNTTFFVDLD